MTHFFKTFALPKQLVSIFVLVFVRNLSKEQYFDIVLFIYEELNEVICCCFNCSNQIIFNTNFREGSDDFFDELTKIMIQYFYVYGRHDNK